MEEQNGEAKKITVKLSLEEEEDRLVYQCILERNRREYKTIKDYLCAAVRSFAGKEVDRTVMLSAQAEERLCRKLAERLEAMEHRYKSERPGL